MVLTALCDTELQNQRMALPEYREFGPKLDSITLLKAIKILYTGGSDNLHAKHNKAMAQISFMVLRQESFRIYRTLGTSTWPSIRCALSWD